MNIGVYMGGQKMINVILADDQVLLTNTLKCLLERDKTIQVLSCVTDGHEAIKACEKFQPDVVLMDIEMPNLDGLKATKIIKGKYPNIKVLILTTFDNHNGIIESLIAGADGYIVKDLESEDLMRAIDCTHKGLHVMHSSVHQLMIKEFTKLYDMRNNISNIKQDLSLTNIEIEIVKSVAKGRSNKEIAEALGFTEGTVKNKITKLFDKLELSDRTQIAIFAIENNII